MTIIIIRNGIIITNGQGVGVEGQLIQSLSLLCLALLRIEASGGIWGGTPVGGMLEGLCKASGRPVQGLWEASVRPL